MSTCELADLDGQQGAAVERHLFQAGVDLVHALLDRLVRFGGVALQGQQVVLALGLQQVEEAPFVTRQAVALQALQARQEIVGAGQADGEVATVQMAARRASRALPARAPGSGFPPGAARSPRARLVEGRRLVQQPQRHLVADAEQVAEALGVAGEAVEVVHVLAQAH
ncbi:hypothetical protein NB693_25430 [Pantoea ananatis]|uniref:hypothetical protein n=1 Tax=Pantoea ananas TaxID=553 RepID=UPI0022211376|nr:hypothetical protein [Pantoea ananatis]